MFQSDQYVYNNRYNIKFALYLLVIFSGFFTVKLGFSPIYITYILGIFFFLLSSLEGNKNWEFPELNIFSLLCITYMTICYFVIWDYNESAPVTWINLVFSLSYLFVVSIVLSNAETFHIFRSTNLFMIASIMILIVEVVFRLANPEVPEGWTVVRQDIWWQLYKTSSFMYPDSNSIGLFVVCLIAFIFGMPPAYKSRLTRYLPILIILLFGSLSRASIITFFAILLFQFSKRFQAKTVIRTFFLVGGSVLTYSLIIFDESFQSKLWLIDLVQDHVLYADAATLFIGVGPGNGSAQIGVGTHILPFTLLVEVGICGFALIATLWYKIWRLAPEACTPIFLALLLNGLSFSSFAIPWFYAMVFVLVSLSREASGARFNTYSRL